MKYSCRAICSVESELLDVGFKHYIKSDVNVMSIVLLEESFPISPKNYWMDEISSPMRSIRYKINSI